jgi:general secretion pathway protein L
MRSAWLQFAHSCRAAFLWWVRELSGLVPKRLQRRLAAARGRLILLSTGEGAELLYESNGQSEIIAAIPADADIPPSRSLLATLERRQRRAAGRAVLRLPADRALRLSLSLPAAAQRNLLQVIAFEIDRRTPFGREEVYWAHRVTELDRAKKRMRVELVVVLRAVADAAMRTAATLGLAVARAEVANGDATAFVLDGSLGSHRRRAPGLATLVSASLMGLAVLLTAAALLLPLYRAHAIADALATELAAAKTQAAASQRMQKDIDATIAADRTVFTRKREMQMTSDVLRELTHLLADDTWLTELQLNRGDLQIGGYANSATALLTSLEQSGAFSRSAFRAPVIPDQKLGREQFSITMRVVDGGKTQR